MKKTINQAIMVSLLLLMSFASLILQSPLAEAQSGEKICTLYFTYIGCPNCAYTDPAVLSEWPEEYPNLVVIEYSWIGGQLGDPNSKFFGEYAQAYRTQAAVPQLVFSKDNIMLGRLDVPKAKQNIKELISNSCPLINKRVIWEQLNLNELKAKPKIWANGRILIKLEENSWLFQWNGKVLSKEIVGNQTINNSLAKDLLFTSDISAILKNKKFVVVSPSKVKFSGSTFPKSSGLVPYAEFENAIEINVKAPSAPSIATEQEQPSPEEKEKKTEEIELPLFGKIKTEEFSLPLLTAIFAVADGLTNPCGFFVLFFLVGALIGLAGARKRIFLVGSIFVLFFIIYYFLFMALLLNVFMLGKNLAILTTTAGGVCLFAGILNIKDYFFFGKGLSLSISEKKKGKLTERVKELSLAESNSSLIIGSVIVASAISLVAIACTFGIPLAYTKVLSTESLPSLQYYLYLILYNLIYAIPMLAIVLIIAITLGKGQFGESWIKRLKLISGFVILFLGFVLVWNYILLEHVGFILRLIFSAVIISGLVIFINEILIKKMKLKK